MVDEFQDITMKEFKLLRHLTEEHQNFFVVGDPDQNIYEWRGSRMEVLLKFEENLRQYFEDDSSSYFPGQKKRELTGGFKTIMMNENYRSTPRFWQPPTT
jgi:DNA helicase-2/ATP-dependent DNA helicase PcrA